MRYELNKMRGSCSRIIIAGLSGDSGKTVISVGLIRALQKRGWEVMPFKKGPDYIDMGWLALAANHPCYNLDLFLMEREQILYSFLHHTQGAQLALVEGNRGLYDGLDLDGSVSTAELAKLLKAPVVLVVDCTKVTRTAAAIVLGCKLFDPEVTIRGVILNQVATDRHESIIRTSIERYCNLPILGALPRQKNVTFPGRHLGLVPPQEHPSANQAVAIATEVVEKYLKLDRLWKLATDAPPLMVPERLKRNFPKKQRRQVHIGVIRDSAFQFYYPENLEELTRRGARVVEINSLRDKELPEIDALYIGGGFPETHVKLLSANTSFRNSIREAAHAGLPIYAECGGLMYLGEALVLKGKTYPMAEIFPVTFGLQKRPQGHGYTILEVEKSNPYFSVGCILKGHEFHYSYAINLRDDGISLVFRVKRGYGLDGKRDGLCYKNVLATYSHVHALGTGEWADALVKQATDYKNKRLRGAKSKGLRA
ncbi:MAG TPA: hydrogenobyrinic acid a,c-diamide synthase (glutamine-hydrolyzing) [Syntrophaceae bacterium]|nr:hydrogenobyrinic acid a,c-diamide synthase (glutamine-hydrolyzing) [Syntrophaceae bacterium]